MKIKQKKWRILLVCILFLIGIIICALGREKFSNLPYQTQYNLTEPSYVYQMEGGGMLIIERSKTSVVVVDKDKTLKTVIRGGSESKDAFYYTDYAVTDGEYIYINDVHYGEVGVKVASERIVRFDMQGKYIDTVFEQKYSEDDGEVPMQYGLITGLESKNGVVSFFVIEDEGYRLYRVKGGDVECLRTMIGEEARNASKYTFDETNNLVYFTSRIGEIYKDDGSSVICIHESEIVTEGFPSIPWDVFTTNDGKLFYTDIGKRQITCFTTGEVVLAAMEPLAESPIYYRVASNGIGITTTDSVDCYYLTEQGEVVFQVSQIAYKKGSLLLGWIVWICGIFCAILIAIVSLLAIYQVLSSSLGILKIGFWVGTGVLIVSVMISYTILTSTNKNATNKTLSQIKATTSILSQNLKGSYGDMIEGVSELDDYESEEFAHIKEYLDTYSSEAYKAGVYQYYLLFKVKDNVLYAVMDYEDSITDMHSYGTYEGTEYQQVVEEEKVVTVGGEADSFGMWAYAAAPVYNSNNEIVAIIEVGTDLYSEQKQVNALAKKIVMNTVVLVVIILLLLTEGVYLSDFFEKRKQAKQEGREKKILIYVRFLTFLVFFADSFQDSFIPIVATQLFQKVEFNLSWLEGIGAALPMSLQLLFIAIMALVGGKLIDKFNIRSVVCMGLVVQLCGYALCSYAVGSEDYILLIFGKVLAGAGMGMAIVSLNSIAASAKNEGEKGSLFAGLNAGILSGIAVGVSVGAGIVRFAGYKGAYAGAVGIIALSVLFAIKFVHAQKRERIEEDTKEITTRTFLSNREVLSLLLFIIIPFLILMYFKDYLFPLFATEKGMSETSISNVFLFCGAILIFLGPGLTKWFFDKLGGKITIVLASIFYVMALIIFGIHPSLETSIIAVFMICVGASFGLANQSMYYSELPIVSRYGDGKSMGIYSLFDNLGQTIGPILFGLMIILGYGKASLILGGIAGILLMIFVLLNFNKKRK